MMLCECGKEFRLEEHNLTDEQGYYQGKVFLWVCHSCGKVINNYIVE